MASVEKKKKFKLRLKLKPYIFIKRERMIDRILIEWNCNLARSQNLRLLQTYLKINIL